MELKITEKAQKVFLESLKAEGLDPHKTYLKLLTQTQEQQLHLLQTTL